MLSLHATDGDYGIFLAFGVDSPEGSELRLIHVCQFLTEVFERVEELLAVCGLVESIAQGVDDRASGSLRRENSDPKIVFEIVAKLLEGRDVGQRLSTFCTRYGERLYFSGANVRQGDRGRRHEEVDVATEHGRYRWSAAVGRQMAHLQIAGRP